MIDINKLIAEAMKELAAATKRGEPTEELNRLKERLSVLKLIKADFTNREKANEIMTEGKQVKALLGMVKSREIVIEKYREGKRLDLVEQMEKEIKILKEMLPPMPSEDDINAATVAAIHEIYAVNGTDFKLSMKDLKTVISKVQDFLPLADGGVISKAFRTQL